MTPHPLVSRWISGGMAERSSGRLFGNWFLDLEQKAAMIMNYTYLNKSER